MNPDRWTEITPSEYAWEQEALEYLKARIPDDEPFRAWSNFEFIAGDGSINEVDLLVVSLHKVYLVEIKSWSGTISGDSSTWRREVDGREFLVDNPLLLANRKAKKLGSILTAQRALAKKRRPFIEAAVFLFRNDDRLMKTLLLSALADGVEALRALTPARLAALNHGTVRSPIPGQESQIVLGKCRQWAAQAGEIKVADDNASPLVSLHVVGVDTESILELDLEERRRLTTWTDALRRLIGQADALGVLVMVSGVVGSNNRRRLEPQEFRGFVLVDPVAPLVFVNGADTKAAQMFTLAHELAHVWLGQSAVSDADARAAPEQEIERWCNRVAAELLVPQAVLRDEYDGHAELQLEVNRLARRFKVSTLVILRRIHDAGQLTRQELWAAYDAEVNRLRAMPRGSGGDFYLTLGARVSKRFARAIVASTLEGQTSFIEAFRMLGVKKLATFNELGRNLGMEH